MIRMRTIVGASLISLFCSTLMAQEVTPCEETLNMATDEFNAGRFYGVPGMLANCIEKGFTREQRQRAYLLLTQTYLLLDDPIAAENSYLEVLRANPEFTTDPNQDPIDVVYLSKKFTASPIFSVFGRTGGNVSPVRVIYDIFPYPAASDKYTLKPGWQFAVGADWNYSEHLALSAEISYSLTAYKRQLFNIFGEDVWELYDRLSLVSVPVSVKYSFDWFYKNRIRKFIPYALAGASIGYLLSDRGELQIFNHDGENTEIEESPTIDFGPYRNQIHASFFIGAGAKYKWKLDYLFADVRYAFGINNVVIGTSTFDNTGPATEFGYTDSYFRLDNLAISIGYVRPLYKPRKLKKARTKSVLRELKKEE